MMFIRLAVPESWSSRDGVLGKYMNYSLNSFKGGNPGEYNGGY